MVNRWRSQGYGTSSRVDIHCDDNEGPKHRAIGPLGRRDWERWKSIPRPAGGDVLKVWPVSKQVNSPRNNGAELMEVVG